MARRFFLSFTLLLFSIAVVQAANWPSWRGPTGQGATTETGLPTKWSATENVKWKIPLPDEGNSTPAVWGDKIFVTQATDGGKNRGIICFSRKDGTKFWEKYVRYEEKEPTHKTNPFCAGSATTDGERVYAFYGSAGLYCYDIDGKELWKRDFGKCVHMWGNSSTPVVYNNLLYLNFGPNEKTFLLALDKTTGKDVWKADSQGKPAQEYFGSWSTPVIADVKGQTQLVMSWPGAVKGYEPETGKEVWSCKGLQKDAAKDTLTYSTPLVTSDAIVAMAGFGGPSIGLKTGGSGDVTESHRLWRRPKNPQSIGSGVIVGDHVYAVNEPSIACIELKTGKDVWREAIPGGVWSSIVLSDGKMYVVSQQGETWIIAAKPEFEVIARNKLDGATTRGSIVPADGELFIRTYKHLWCIGSK